MKYRWRIGNIPNGADPVVSQSVAVRRISDDTTITTLATDADGFITLEADGHYEPFYLYLTSIPGGDKYWRSDDSHTVSVFSPKELPVALRSLGDGVVTGWATELFTQLLGGGPSVEVGSGAAVVAGHPFVQNNPLTLTIARPVTGTRVDRIIIRLYPEGSATTPGKADIAVLQGTIDAGRAALTQTATVHEFGLYILNVPSAGAVQLVDERQFAHDTEPITATTRGDTVSTTSGSGELLTTLTTDLILPRTATYDVEAWVNAVQDKDGGWVLQATYGSFGAGTSPNFSSPAQVAVAPISGKIYVADTGNNRLVRLNTDGTYDTSITGLTNITGVCVDSSDGAYVVHNGRFWKKYNSSLVLQWAQSTPAGIGMVHLATDSTHFYATDSNSQVIRKFLCSNGSVVTFWGSAGSGNGQLNAPWGIAVNAVGGAVYVVDSGNARVQLFSTAGVYNRQFPVAAGSRGMAIDSGFHALVAEPSVVNRYTSIGDFVDTLTQGSPEGIAVASGDVVWVSNYASHNIAKWDESASGYGGLAIDINGDLSSYITLGNIDGTLQNSHTRTVVGPATYTVSLYGKATSGAATFRSVVLSARATPRS